MSLVEKYLINEVFDETAIQINNEIERCLKKYFGKGAKVLGAGILKKGKGVGLLPKSKIIVTKDQKDYVITIEPK